MTNQEWRAIKKARKLEWRALEKAIKKKRQLRRLNSLPIEEKPKREIDFKPFITLANG